MLNSVKGKRERIGRMLEMNANDRTDIDEARAGDIIAIVGCKDTTTGETLCDPENPIILEKMEFPEPVIEVSVEPKTKADQDKMTNALIKLAAEDPSFRFSRDEESGQTIIEGMGELHLEIICDRMSASSRSSARSARLRSPTARRSRARRRSSTRTRSSRAARASSVKVVVKVEPSRTGEDAARASSSSRRSRAANIPKEYIPGVEKGLATVRQKRRPRRLPDHRLHRDAVDGAYHDVDSSAIAFEIAGRGAMRARASLPGGGGIKLIEPMMKVEVITPEDPGPRRLREEHDHRCRPDGRRDPGGERR